MMKEEFDKLIGRESEPWEWAAANTLYMRLPECWDKQTFAWAWERSPRQLLSQVGELIDKQQRERKEEGEAHNEAIRECNEGWRRRYAKLQRELALALVRLSMANPLCADQAHRQAARHTSRSHVVALCVQLGCPLTAEDKAYVLSEYGPVDTFAEEYQQAEPAFD